MHLVEETRSSDSQKSIKNVMTIITQGENESHVSDKLLRARVHFSEPIEWLQGTFNLGYKVWPHTKFEISSEDIFYVRPIVKN